MSAVFFATLLYLPQFMTKDLHYSALRAGAGLLPMMGTFAAVSFAAGPLYERVGPKPVVAAGGLCCAAGGLLLSFLDSGDRYSAPLPGLCILGAGVGRLCPSVPTRCVGARDH